MHAIDSLVRVDRIASLKSDASLFERQREESDGLGNAVNLETFAGYFTANGVQDEG